ncbi:MAG: methyltransferase domain-containing protein [Oscillibacter sp.]|nr:methyltransferase domain-containing protein [Oscillibacter sp.]
MRYCIVLPGVVSEGVDHVSRKYLQISDILSSGHSYDLAREGYAYLLPPNQKHSAAPGDDRRMAQARRDFLSKGYYELLLNTLCCQILSLCGESPVILDAGCGEGYYTAGIFQALEAAGKSPRMAGTDISKFILRSAAKRERGVEFAVASSYRLPLADGAADLLLDCFSPLALEEFRRVLRPGGAFLYVVPGANHLWELKQVLYDHPYPNEERETPYEGFAYERIVPVDGTVTLPNQTDIQNIFRMTPYYWKTPKSGGERLAALETLEVTVSFRVHVFRKL